MAGAALVGLLGCATTQPVAEVEASGFLGDYSMLESGSEDQGAAARYIRPGTSFAPYEKVIVDPVTVWRMEGSSLDELPPDEAQGLADELHAALVRELENEFEVVQEAGPGTLRLRSALTEAQGARPLLDVASRVLPPARLLSGVKKLATGTHAFVGQVAIEVEILDSASGERLVAAIDKRAGSKALRGPVGTWGAVREAFAYWARRISTRLALFRDIDLATGVSGG